MATTNKYLASMLQKRREYSEHKYQKLVLKRVRKARSPKKQVRRTQIDDRMEFLYESAISRVVDLPDKEELQPFSMSMLKGYAARCHFDLFFMKITIKRPIDFPIEELFIHGLKKKGVCAERTNSKSSLLKEVGMFPRKGIPDVIVKDSNGNIEFFEVKSMDDSLRREQLVYLSKPPKDIKVNVAFVDIIKSFEAKYG